MNRWLAVVFDLDDTLYPEREFVMSGFRAVAKWVETYLGFQCDQTFADLQVLYESGVRGDTFNRWVARRGMLDEAVVSRLVHVYREHLPYLELFPEAHALLKRLHRKYKLGLVSDGYLDVQRRKLAALNIQPLFDAIVFSDEWGREAWKPSIKPFHEVLDRLGVSGSVAMYVADNPLKDFLGARAMGMFTVRSQYPGGEYTHLAPPTPRHAPDHTITNLINLEELLP